MYPGCPAPWVPASLQSRCRPQCITGRVPAHPVPQVLVRRSKLHLSLGSPEGLLQSSAASCLLHWGGVASPDPTQSSESSKLLSSSTGGSRVLNVLRRSSRCGSRMLASRVPREAAPGALLLLSPHLLHALVGRQLKLPLLVPPRQFSALAPLGRRRELPRRLSHLGKRCFPRPHPIVGATSCSSSTDCSRGLYVRFVIVIVSSRVLALAVPARAASRASSSSSSLSCPLSLEGCGSSRW